MLKNKKGSFFTLIIVVLLVVILTTAFFALRKKQDPSDKFIGERQYVLINTYQEGEKALFYIDQSAKYSSYQAIFELGQKGGHENFDCGTYHGYAVWATYDGNKDIKECYPKNVEENFKSILNKRLDEYIKNHNQESFITIPLENYEIEIKGNLQIIGNAARKIEIPITS